ncbi:hypothetical protein Y032_0112g276 [Ancylostoma ceylanicum]|nr:hypothetical protein Y032_0112g276 [Ancylostoma ceylanicum]
MSGEERSVVIKVFREEVPRLDVVYKNKHELFEAYKKWLKQLNLPSNEVYWCDSAGDHTGIRNADDLLGAVQDYGYAKFLTFRDDDVYISCSDSEDEQSTRGRSKEKKRTRNSRPTDRTPSPSPSPRPSRESSGSRSLDRRRHRSLSEPRHGRHHHMAYSYDHMPFPWNFPMDPRFMPSPYFYHPCDVRAPTCRCKDSCKDVDKL